MGEPSTDPAATEFERHRPLLFGIAYRMLGSAMEAEDVLQETYLRYRAVNPMQIQTPKAYLSKIVTHLCLDYLKSAQVQRELYVGPWLPEPIKTGDGGLDSQTDSLSMAFLVMLEKLSPAERAVFLLHEVFDYSYIEIGRLLDKEAAACRQLYHRAKQHIMANRPRYQPKPDEHQAILGKFLMAINEGDVQGLVSLLAEDATVWSDGGGKVTAATRPVSGREKVAALLASLRRFVTDEMSVEFAYLNTSPAIIVKEHGVLHTVMILEIWDDTLHEVRIIVNPDKLRHLSQHL